MNTMRALTVQFVNVNDLYTAYFTQRPHSELTKYIDNQFMSQGRTPMGMTSAIFNDRAVHAGQCQG